jgi:hypothetical protein
MMKALTIKVAERARIAKVARLSPNEIMCVGAGFRAEREPKKEV